MDAYYGRIKTIINKNVKSRLSLIYARSSPKKYVKNFNAMLNTVYKNKKRFTKKQRFTEQQKRFTEQQRQKCNTIYRFISSYKRD